MPHSQIVMMHKSNNLFVKVSSLMAAIALFSTIGLRSATADATVVVAESLPTENKGGHGEHHHHNHQKPAHSSPKGDGSHGEEHHGEAPHKESHHHHGKLEVPAGSPIPDIALVVHEDAMQGWNLEVKLTNFQFAPESVNQDNSLNAGHAHLYINGEKVTRLYSSWYYLQALPAGEHEIRVTLNTNTHQDLTHNGALIQATTMLTVPAENAAQ